MYEQGGRLKKFPMLIEGLAHHLGCEQNKLTKLIEAMLHDFELLVEDDKYIWSERVLRNVYERQSKCDLRASAGSLGGVKSGVTRSKRSKSKQHFEANEANEAKERKGKERKVNIIHKDIPPKIELVVEFFKDQAMAEDFFDFYSSKGWLVGKVPMKDWEACARRWKKNNFGVPIGRSTLTKTQSNVVEGLERLKERYGNPYGNPKGNAVGEVCKISGSNSLSLP
jgi:hypothetical protein